MTNTVKEILTFVAAALALAVILFSSARAGQPEQAASDVEAQIASYTQSVGQDLFAVNSAVPPTKGEIDLPPVGFAANDDVAEPVRVATVRQKRARSAWFDPINIRLDR